MEGLHHESVPVPPENPFQYENMLQIKLAERAFPDVPHPMIAWTDGEDSPAVRFRRWAENPDHPHVHLDEPDGLDALLADLGIPTIH